jgi:hypothetical protein
MNYMTIIHTEIDQNLHRMYIFFTPGSHWLWDMIQEYWILLSHPMMRRMHAATPSGTTKTFTPRGQTSYRARPLFDILEDELSNSALSSLTNEDDFYVNVPRLPGNTNTYAYLALNVNTQPSSHNTNLFAENMNNHVFICIDFAPFPRYYHEAYIDLNERLVNAAFLFDQSEYGFNINQHYFDIEDSRTYHLDANQIHHLNQICYHLTRYFAHRTDYPDTHSNPIYLVQVRGWASTEPFNQGSPYYIAYQRINPRGPRNNQQLSLARAIFVSSYIDHWMRATNAFEHFVPQKPERLTTHVHRDTTTGRIHRDQTPRQIFVCRQEHASQGHPEDFRFAESRRQPYRRGALRYMRNSFGLQVPDPPEMTCGWEGRFLIQGRGTTTAFTNDDTTETRDANRRVTVAIRSARAPRRVPDQGLHLLCLDLDDEQLRNYRISDRTRAAAILRARRLISDNLRISVEQDQRNPMIPTAREDSYVSRFTFILWLLENNEFVRYPLYRAQEARQRADEIQTANVDLAACRYDTLIRSYAARSVFLNRPVRSHDSENYRDAEDLERFWAASVAGEGGNNWYDKYHDYWIDTDSYWSSSGSLDTLDDRLNPSRQNYSVAVTYMVKLSYLYEIWDDLKQANHFRRLASTPGGVGPNRQTRDYREYLYPSNRSPSYGGRELDGSASYGNPNDPHYNQGYPDYIGSRLLQVRIREEINRRRVAYPTFRSGAIPRYQTEARRNRIDRNQGRVDWVFRGHDGRVRPHPYRDVVGARFRSEYYLGGARRPWNNYNKNI